MKRDLALNALAFVFGLASLALVVSAIWFGRKLDDSARGIAEEKALAEARRKYRERLDRRSGRISRREWWALWILIIVGTVAILAIQGCGKRHPLAPPVASADCGTPRDTTNTIAGSHEMLQCRSRVDTARVP